MGVRRAHRTDGVLITNDSRPVAALIDTRLFECIRRMQERFDALCDRLERNYAGVPEDLATAEIEKAGAPARPETADAWRAAGRLTPLPAACAPVHAAGPQPPAAINAGRISVRAKSSPLNSSGSPRTLANA